ncbi:MAG: PQQ-binding-like beta-propeller repeat protein [Haloarcula sp.]
MDRDVRRRSFLKAAGGSVGIASALAGSEVGRVAAQETRNIWPQFCGDTANSGYRPDSTGPRESATAGWTVGTGAAVESSPAVTSGFAYCGSTDGNLYAVRDPEGEERWRFETDGAIRTGVSIRNDTVYFANDAGTIYAVDTTTGDERWSQNTPAQVRSSPTVVDDTVYVGGDDDKLRALFDSLGTSRWRFETGGPVRSSPAVVDGTVYVGSDDGNVYALAASNGSEEWSTSVGGSVRSAPTVVNGTVYVGRTDGNIYALDAATGRQEWVYETFIQGVSSPAVVDGRVYIGSRDGTFYALDAADGTQEWTVTVADPIESSPAVAEDTVYFSATDGAVYALDIADGSQRWRFETGATITSSPAVARDRVYIGSGDQQVYSLRAATGSQTTGGGDQPTEATPIETTSSPGPETQTQTPSGTVTEADTPGSVGGEPPSSGDGDTGGGFSLPGAGGALAAGATVLGAVYIAYRRVTAGDDTTDYAQPGNEGGSSSVRTPSEMSERSDGERETESGSEQESTRERSEGQQDSAADPSGGFAGINSIQPLSTTGPVHTSEGVLAGEGIDVLISALSPEYADNDDAAEAFESAVRRWSGISHNLHVAETYESGTVPRPWVAFEAGETTLADQLSDTGDEDEGEDGDETDGEALDTADRVAIVADTAEALRTGDLYQLSHGSLTPETIHLATDSGDDLLITVSDWGLTEAVHHAVGEQHVTPYTAPEQLDEDSPVIAETPVDTYRLGAVAYRLMTGREPYEGSEHLEAAIREGDLTPPSEVADVPDMAEQAILTAMATEPDDRYGSPYEFRGDFTSAFD